MLLPPFLGLHFAVKSKISSHRAKAYIYYYALSGVVLPEKILAPGKKVQFANTRNEKNLQSNKPAWLCQAISIC
jgi:hypothetical protein